MFSVPKNVDLHFLSIEAHKRLKRIAKQYRSTTQREAWIEAVGELVATFVRENRPRRKEEELVQKFLIFDPILLAPGARSSDAVQRLQNHMPCYCNVDAVWYSNRKKVYVIWDSEILEGLGLPPRDADIVIFSLKHYLPVCWIAANHKGYRELSLPTNETLAKIDMSKDLSLADTFAIIFDADKHVRDSSGREEGNHRSAARMIKVVFEVAKQHHEKNQRQYDEFTLQLADQLFVDAVDSFRHQMTGGIRPLKKDALEDQKSELLRLNLNRVFHEVYCKPKKSFPHCPPSLKFCKNRLTYF